jgi:ABC-2 type transport system ATP-binding protein
VLSSHLLHQVQAICDRVGLFHQGKMVLEGTVHDLARKVLGGAYQIHLEVEAPDLTDRLQALPSIVRVQRANGHYHLEAERDLRDEVSRAVMESGGKLLLLRPEQPSLDDVYTGYFREMAYAA